MKVGLTFYLLLGISILFFKSNLAFAYPTTIGLGYNSCIVCHYNPYGNGPLTDYGRGVSATAIAAKPLYIESIDDQTLANQSGFFGSWVELPSWFRLSGDFRSLYLVNQFNADHPVKRWVIMQAEMSAIFKLKKNKLYGVFTYGYIPPPSSFTGSRRDEVSTWISREHYIGYRPIKKLTLMAGFFDPIYGVKTSNHIAFHRTRTALNQNDQSHGIGMSYDFSQFNLGAHVFLGNLFQTQELRQLGGTLRFEYRPESELAFGISGLYTSNSFRKRQMTSIHAKLGIGKGSSLLSEIGFIREAPLSQNAQLGQYIWISPTVKIIRGLYLINAIEYYSQGAFESDIRRFRLTPGIQFFPAQRIELRIEVQADRNFSDSVVNRDSMSFLGQFHLWL